VPLIILKCGDRLKKCVRICVEFTKMVCRMCKLHVRNYQFLIQTYDSPSKKADNMMYSIGRVSYLIYISVRHHVLTTSGDMVVCFHTAVCSSC